MFLPSCQLPESESSSLQWVHRVRTELLKLESRVARLQKARAGTGKEGHIAVMWQAQPLCSRRCFQREMGTLEALDGGPSSCTHFLGGLACEGHEGRQSTLPGTAHPGPPLAARDLPSPEPDYPSLSAQSFLGALCGPAPQPREHSPVPGKASVEAGGHRSPLPKHTLAMAEKPGPAVIAFLRRVPGRQRRGWLLPRKEPWWWMPSTGSQDNCGRTEG